MTAPQHRLVLAATAERSLARLPEGLAAAIVEFMLGALVDAPRRVGHPLQRELAGLSAARRGPYRIVYEIEDDHPQCESSGSIIVPTPTATAEQRNAQATRNPLRR